jgi:hypothetical protein
VRSWLTLFCIMGKFSPEEIENWEKVKRALEEADKTDCYFYKRAVAILKTGRDPMRW